MQNTQSIQGILSIGALICLAVGWFNLFSPQLNHILYNIVFYVLIGLSFYFAASSYPNKNYQYISYVAAALCIVGAFLPLDSRFAGIKIIGLFAGAIISFFNRQSQQR